MKKTGFGRRNPLAAGIAAFDGARCSGGSGANALIADGRATR